MWEACPRCGLVIPTRSQPKHVAWHEKVDDKLDQAREQLVTIRERLDALEAAAPAATPPTEGAL